MKRRETIKKSDVIPIAGSTISHEPILETASIGPSPFTPHLFSADGSIGLAPIINYYGTYKIIRRPTEPPKLPKASVVNSGYFVQYEKLVSRIAQQLPELHNTK